MDGKSAMCATSGDVSSTGEPSILQYSIEALEMTEMTEREVEKQQQEMLLALECPELVHDSKREELANMIKRVPENEAQLLQLRRQLREQKSLISRAKYEVQRQLYQEYASGQRLAKNARRRIKFSQRTEGQRLRDAHQRRLKFPFMQDLDTALTTGKAVIAETRQAQQQQKVTAATPAVAASQAQHEQAARVVVHAAAAAEATRIAATVWRAHQLSLVAAEAARIAAAVRRPDHHAAAETRRARQQQQANAAATAAAALQARHEKTIRLTAARGAEIRRALQRQANAATAVKAALQARHKEMTKRAVAKAAATEAAEIAAEARGGRQLLGKRLNAQTATVTEANATVTKKSAIVTKENAITTKESATVTKESAIVTKKSAIGTKKSYAFTLPVQLKTEGNFASPAATASAAALSREIKVEECSNIG